MRRRARSSRPRRAGRAGRRRRRARTRSPSRPDAQAALRALWSGSVAAKVERVACLASVIDDDTLRIPRVLPLDRRRRLARRSPPASLETCGPPEWQGTVHTHIALRRWPAALLACSPAPTGASC